MIRSSNSRLEDTYYQMEDVLTETAYHVHALAEMLLDRMKRYDRAVRETDDFEKLHGIMRIYGLGVDDNLNITLPDWMRDELEEYRKEQERYRQILEAERIKREEALRAELSARPVVGVKLTDNPVEWNNKVLE